ncbi:MAG TPA: hypothetical protein VJ743_14370 [Albitalea sp.]|nr:hypothetical protein [Albitalea sp.]
MKTTSLIALAAAVAALAAAPVSFAQSPTQVQEPPPVLPPPGAPVEPPQTPPPIVIETTVDLRSGGPQSPESEADARKEAIGALAEAKTACRRERDRQAMNACLRQAQDDYNAMLGRGSPSRRAR